MLLTFGRMRQVTDNYKNLVKIQIFLQFALGSVKVLGDYCFFVSVCVGFFVLFFIFHTAMLEILCYSFVAYRKKEKPQKQNVIANIKKINPHRLKHFSVTMA